MAVPTTTHPYTKVVGKEEDAEAAYPDVPVEIDPELLYPVKTTSNKKTKNQKSFMKNGLRRRGVCPCCCYIVLGLVGVSILLMTIAVTWMYVWTRIQVQRYTVPEGRELPATFIPVAEIQLVKDRATMFVDSIEAGVIPDNDFRITVDEMNGFIAQSNYLRSHAYVTVDSKDTIQMDMSLPMDFLPGGKGRFFVGTVRMEIEKADDTTEPEEEEDPTRRPVKHLVTFQLDTPALITPDPNIPLLFANMEVFWDEAVTPHYKHELNVVLQNGSFNGTAIPQDVIDQMMNLAQGVYDVCDQNDDDDDACDAAKLLDGIKGVTIDLLALTINARRDNDSDSNNMAITTGTTSSSGTGTTSLIKSNTWNHHATRKLMKWFLN